MELTLFHGSPQIVEEPIIIRNPNRINFKETIKLDPPAKKKSKVLNR